MCSASFILSDQDRLRVVSNFGDSKYKGAQKSPPTRRHIARRSDESSALSRVTSLELWGARLCISPAHCYHRHIRDYSQTVDRKTLNLIVVYSLLHRILQIGLILLSAHSLLN